ncbi:antitoxin Xre/MbcA/ParS toxin-binding domain-containing protein [Deinococcus aestuarii]|uniref:antitoxin Xre/MbcA/ParS toxin-binding domain-containing protein n=1 Tax=Deinococcus aestuarii TaxID=2774531 RepID=UPI001C0C0C42|nr:antitoxin Xre/MbcA/ParS toxin-binding domain-containing protein [Deinococcus aestuarii]
MTSSASTARRRPASSPHVGAGGRDEVFKYVTGVDAPEVIAIIIGGDGRLIPAGVSVGRVADRLAEVFGVRKAEAARLLGVSESTVSRRTKPSPDVLDRTLAASEVFANVAAVLGPDGARTWFRTPSPAFDDHTPLDLLRTRTGERQVENVVESLLNGAFL